MDVKSQYRWEAYKSIHYYNRMHRRYKLRHSMILGVIAVLGILIAVVNAAFEEVQWLVEVLAVIVVSLAGWSINSGVSEKATILGRTADTFASVFLLCIEPNATEEEVQRAFREAYTRTSGIPIHSKILRKSEEEARESYPKNLRTPALEV